MKTGHIEMSFLIAESEGYPTCADYARDEFAEIKAELADLRKDKARLDWLADKENKIGNVQLPTAVFDRTLMLRDAIDLAMAMKN